MQHLVTSPLDCGARQYRSHALFVICAALLAGVSAHAQEAQQVDAIFAERAGAEKPGCAVVIVKDGALAYENGYGMADLEHHVKITPQTAFDVASVAKQFTGLGVAMLIEQGKLQESEDIRGILPWEPDFGRKITIGNLLHHTSGLRDWPETLFLSGADGSSPITLDMITAMVERQRELDFLPGEEFQYSNTGYNLLAAAVVKLTSQPFPKWMSENIFAPLGMTHTFVADSPTALIADRADSYAPAGKSGYVPSLIYQAKSRRELRLKNYRLTGWRDLPATIGARSFARTYARRAQG
jgi:CubicO group peptidase (beta-lactamase class C family)